MMSRALLLASIAFFMGCISQTQQRQAATRVDLGTAYLVEGNAPGAVEILREATELDPRNWNAWNKLGLATLSLGAFEESESSFLRAVDLAPEEAEVRINYGTMLMRQRRQEEAIEQYRAALEDLTYRRPALVMSNLGNAYNELGEFEQAIYWLDQAITRAPNLCQARFNRGISLRGLEQMDRALEDFETVIQLCSDDSLPAYYQAGQVLIELDDRTSGCVYIQHVISEVPETPIGRDASNYAEREC